MYSLSNNDQYRITEKASLCVIEIINLCLWQEFIDVVMNTKLWEESGNSASKIHNHIPSDFPNYANPKIHKFINFI